MFGKTRSIFIFFFLIQSFVSLAQTNSSRDYSRNSPYSRFGIGEVWLPGSIRNIGMGGTGISHSHPEFFNSLNPALLISKRFKSYDSLYSILDGGIFAEYRKSKDNNSIYQSGTINFNSFSYTVPLSKKWTSSIGLRPFTDVSYTTKTTEKVIGSPNDSVNILYSGTGGLYQAEFANGVRVTRNINLGLSSSVLFGRISNTSYSQRINGADSTNLSGINNRAFYSGFLLRPGGVYRMQLNKHAKSIDSAIFINAGITYDFFLGTKADEEIIVERRTSSNILLSQNIVNSTNKDVTIPGTLKVGLSFDKGYAWNIAADFAYSNTKNFKGTNPSDVFRNSFTLGLGGEFGFVRGRFREELESVKLWRRQYLRAGIIYSRTPYYIQGKQINDFAITLGGSFHVGDNKKINTRRGVPKSKVNVAIIVGQRGTLSNFLVKDQYFRAYLGLTINEKWFLRRRVE